MSGHIPFQNIEHSAAWYYTKFPGFLTEEYYHSFAEWDKGIRNVKDLTEEERNYLQDSNKNHTQDSSVFSVIEEEKQKQSDNGICDQFIRENSQSDTELRSKK